MDYLFQLEVVPLHDYPEYKEDCIKILNQQWPRSETIRYRSLNSSCSELPMSLVLRGIKNGAYCVIGHSRLNILPNVNDSIWIESVVIHPDLRGRGYGKALMTGTENYALSLGYKHCILSTHDQQEFYLKLGYKFCPPVSLYGGIINKNLLPKVYSSYVTPMRKSEESGNNDKSHFNYISGCNSENANINELNSLIPAPPPPPPVTSFIKKPLQKCDIQRVYGTKQFMCKQIS